MKNKKAFTLMEIVIVLIIVGVMAAVCLPSLFSSTEQTKAQVAKNNLLAIAAAQEKFNEDYPGNYCISTGANPTGSATTCGNTQTHLNTFLNLGMSDTFTYSCSNAAAPYQCIANDGVTVVLHLNVTATGVSISCPTGGQYCPN